MEVKCKACDGTGKIMATIYENDEIGFVDKTYDCCCCNGTGKIKITNEEWFCALPTKDKAKFLEAQQKHGGTIASRSDVDWEYWLKEKHEE